MILPTKVYEILRWFIWIVLPAVGVFLSKECVPLRGNEMNKDEDRLFFKRVTHSLERKRKVLQKKDKRTGEEACL